jgi:sigma-E factor negative regulatory protein RseC
MSGIVHKGIIRKGENGTTQVELLDAVNCDACSAKGGCQLGAARDHVYQLEQAGDYRDGDLVEVELSEQLAVGALFWAYLFPFIVLFAGLVILLQFFSEGLAGLIAIVFLAIYYIMVYLNKRYFEKKFQLKIKSYD